MHKIRLLIALMLFVQAASALKYNGVSLSTDQSFTRTQCGTTDKDIITEVSGLACSRVTPGYLWAVWDEGTNSVMAITPSGSRALTLNLSGTGSRDDWEDICTGAYLGVNYLFIGAFGDNELQYAGNYKIHYLPEPAITSSSASATVSTINFAFPDNAAHNVETLMYDSVEHMFYIVDKAKDVAPSLYKLPFLTNYSGTQTLTFVCRLGTDGEKFDLATAGDISPSGNQMTVKNGKYILLWQRQGSESLSLTATRPPLLISAYQEEEQGESLAWLNDSIFYTTSDSKKNTPIYSYTRSGAQVTPDPVTPTDTTTTPLPSDTTSTLLVDYQANVGIFAYSGTAKNNTSAAKYNADNTKPQKVINFANSWRSVNNGDTTFNYVAIRPSIGGFLAGDSLVLSGYFNNADNSKQSAAVIYYSCADDSPVFTSAQFVNGRTQSGIPPEEYFVIPAACDSLCLARQGNTGTNLLVLKVYRRQDSAATPDPSGPDTPTAIASPAGTTLCRKKLMINGKIYILLGNHIYTPHGILIR